MFQRKIYQDLSSSNFIMDFNLINIKYNNFDIIKRPLIFFRMMVLLVFLLVFSAKLKSNLIRKIMLLLKYETANNIIMKTTPKRCAIIL